jgi:hypothetical protein
MLRTAVVVSLGLGLVGSSHVAGLAVVAVVLTALLASVPEWWRPRKARALRVEIRPPHAHHFHYCDACDDQWAHPGESTACTVHWAARCAPCDETGVPPRDRRTA